VVQKLSLAEFLSGSNYLCMNLIFCKFVKGIHKSFKVMNIEARKITFIQEFLKLDNEDVINSLEQLLKKSKGLPIEERFEPMSIEALNDRIDKSMEDSRNGRVVKAEDLKAKYK
jgi:hypothetical protein